MKPDTRSTPPRESGEFFRDGEYQFKLGDQWFYKGNRSPSWLYVASYPDGSCQGGICEKVPKALWPFLNDTAEKIAGLKAMGHAVVNTIAAGAGVAQSESVHWIKNSLPEPGVAVLAWWDFVQEKGTPTETNFAIAVYNGHYWHAADDDEDDYRDPIAWMRLPEKP